MSSSINVFGIAPNTWIPGPDFKAGYDDKGMWNGSQTFTCRKFDFESTPIKTAFRRGTSAPVVYPNLSAAWNFLLIDVVDHEHQAGGITKIFVTYKGYSTEWQTDKNPDDGSETSGTYAYVANLTERPIIEHPKFIADVDDNERMLIVRAYNGQARRIFSEAYVRDAVITVTDMNDRPIGTSSSVTGTPGRLWWNRIIDDGLRTYEASSIEWTHSATNQGGVPVATLAKHGWIDAAPDGNPPVIDGRNWRLTGITDSQTKVEVTVAGVTTIETTSDYSITWMMSPPGIEWDVDLYTQP